MIKAAITAALGWILGKSDCKNLDVKNRIRLYFTFSFEPFILQVSFPVPAAGFSFYQESLPWLTPLGLCPWQGLTGQG